MAVSSPWSFLLLKVSTACCELDRRHHLDDVPVFGRIVWVDMTNIVVDEVSRSPPECFGVVEVPGFGVVEVPHWPQERPFYLSQTTRSTRLATGAAIPFVADHLVEVPRWPQERSLHSSQTTRSTGLATVDPLRMKACLLHLKIAPCSEPDTTNQSVQ